MICLASLSNRPSFTRFESDGLSGHRAADMKQGGHLPCVPTPLPPADLSYSKKLAAFLSPPR